MKKLLFIVVFLLTLFACKEDPNDMQGKDVINRDKFINILVDVHTMDAMLSSPKYFRKYEPGDSVNIYQSIFDKYNVTQADFDSTVVAYTKRPDLYMEVYDEVILRLNLKLDQQRNNEPSFEKKEN